MNEDIRLVDGGVPDLDAAMTVMNAAFNPVFGETWSAPQFGGALSLPGAQMFLARRQTATVGFALTRRLLDEAELLLLAVRPEYTRKGIGRQLLDHVVEKLREVDVAFIHIEVRIDNPAIDFYERLDFIRVGLRRDYYRGIDGKYRDAITFKRRIL
jgi:[ribosomal protein S18]-alanine N-acetyltransferase